MEGKARNRLCSLCHHYYGSGLRDNVTASEVLRARRMLLERGSPDDPALQQGLDHFLDDITKQRGKPESNYHAPLDICAFCIQFLPPVYQEDKLDDALRSQLLMGSSRGPGQNRNHANRNQHSAGARSRANATNKGSSLVIQHQFAKLKPSASPSDPRSPFTAASSSAPLKPTPPASKPSYRLLTNDITRVLRIESPQAAIAMEAGNNNTLLGNEEIQDLRRQEKQQAAAILRSTRAKQEAKLRRCLDSVDTQASSFWSSASRGKTDNIMHAIRASGAADSLYTGVVVAPACPESAIRRRATELRKVITTTHEASHSMIKTQRNGRFFKTELLFPRVKRMSCIVQEKKTRNWVQGECTRRRDNNDTK